MSSHDEGKGLTTEEAEELHAKYGYNEVKTSQTPEWKKILLRYLDRVSIVIVSFQPLWHDCSVCYVPWYLGLHAIKQLKQVTG